MALNEMHEIEMLMGEGKIHKCMILGADEL